MYIVNTNYLFDGNRKYGYQVFLTDDTKNQKYIALLDKYNYELEEEVDAKTQHIIEMHDNLIMSMATMVESRDNSTGGHIKRTSEGVRILIEEMKKDEAWDLSEEFCKDIIKAAPMHDLGKVAVDDAILRKPGRFTPEEFEIMKSHAAEGAKIVHEILKETDDESFKKVAENVAHYHHERMDGSGYPEGLKGDEIPLEARIMAIADVYDALVSKRVYKEKMSFEEADKIMMESMGKHFDKRLEPFYIKARPKLEEYYSTIE
jgi:HD-GYP domain-containing protein (c-di-GMP phosphodiesterase class II)